ncbi:MAG: NAD-dependent epimerase/dehydratase family protein [Gemmatimonadota bacterium]|nr:NAD-dependent epimerase/dehydratase family protein [Gemmatimonadota bacterium]
MVACLLESGWSVRAVIRNPDAQPSLPPSVSVFRGDITHGGWEPQALAGVDSVIHLAARVHIMREQNAEKLAEYREANTAPTARLAKAASDAGVRRFIYVGSVKAHGAERDEPYRSDETLQPSEAYGRSKAEAEVAVRTLFPGEHIIVRPTFVYGEGSKGNFPRLVRLARVGAHVPLPLGGITNRRSMIYVGNLAALLVYCLTCNIGPVRNILAADAESISTSDLLKRIGMAVGARPRLFRVPHAILRAGGKLVGRQAEVARLTGNLTVDTTELYGVIGWRQPFTLDDALARSLRAPSQKAGQ